MAGSVKIRIKIGVPSASLTEASAGLIGEALHKHSPELAAFELENIRARTPYRYGALRESASAKPYPSKNSRALVKLYYEDEPQLFEWHRVYAPYQEYLPVGLSTYTPQKAQMLYHVQDEDASQIEEWATRTTERALDEWTAIAQAEADAKLLEEAVF